MLEKEYKQSIEGIGWIQLNNKKKRQNSRRKIGKISRKRRNIRLGND